MTITALTDEACPLVALPPNAPLPSHFHSILTAGCTLRVLVTDSPTTDPRTAVLCMRNHSSTVRDIWTSDANDAALARGVLTAIRSLYAQQLRGRSSEPISIRVRRSESALLSVVKSMPSTAVRVMGYGQSKSIDVQAAQATLKASKLSHRSFDSDDEYMQWVHDDATFYAQLLTSLGLAHDYQDEYDKMRASTVHALPLGRHTPTHHFRCLYAADGSLLGRVWFDVDEATGMSYCFKFLIEEKHRGKGLGKSLLAAWELSAAQLGATTMLLHVYDQNKPAFRLYNANGFVTDANTYELLTE